MLRLLRKRFGPLGPADTHRVTSVDGATLDGMLDRVLTATTLREALG
ncbi:MAG: transposase [Deltaproteobacteria bacterium]|nr:transposase [Deltaproteobacteria bacterium]